MNNSCKIATTLVNALEEETWPRSVKDWSKPEPRAVIRFLLMKGDSLTKKKNITKLADYDKDVMSNISKEVAHHARRKVVKSS